MDRVGADYFHTIQMIRERLTLNAYPVNMPMGREENFEGVIDLNTQCRHIILIL